MSYQKNTAYLFIPFVFSRQTSFASVVATLDNSGNWSQVQDKIAYMLKFVADKLDSSNRNACQCFHYQLDPSRRQKVGLASEKDWYATKEHPFDGQKVSFRFQILSAQLYVFKSRVGIMAIRLHFEKDDPYWISNAEYYLKKVSREEVFLDDSDQSFTIMTLAEQMLDELRIAANIKTFYYANPSTERANFFTYLEVEPLEDYAKELFYLRRCYSEGYLYIENAFDNSQECFRPSKDTVWGITTEAAVCLACPKLGKGEFIRDTFYKNFQAQYLLMYVLLLHQKYVLYMFLTELGIGAYNNLDTLEQYRRQLYEFETDFVFSCVSEVPQYQLLYGKMTQAFSLRKMFEDVHEPLISLREIRRETAENEQLKRDLKVSRALLLLSILSFFSALIDSFDFIQSFFSWFLGSTGVKCFQVLCILGIFVTVAYVFKNLILAKK